MSVGKTPGSIDEAVAMGLAIQRETAADQSLWADHIIPYDLSCTAEREGKACAETACKNGKKRVYFCTDGQCAYRFVVVDC